MLSFLSGENTVCLRAEVWVVEKTLSIYPRGG